MSRWLSPLMAFCLSFIIIVALAPSLGVQIDRQIDFWLLWLFTMVILALPLVYLEIGLAKRSKTSALNALSTLTRDADASQRWRIVGWLSVVFIPFLAGALIFNSTQWVLTQIETSVQPNIIFLVGAVLAFALSFISRKILVLLTAVGVVVTYISAQWMGVNTAEWQVTPVEFKEWGHATILALVASGLGLGLYWQTNLSNDQKEAATKSTLPIWIAQLVAVIAFGYFAINSTIPAYGLITTSTVASALLLQMAKEQLQQRNVVVLLQFALILVALLIWAVPNLSQILTPLLVLWGLVICLIYAIFVGWIMKISHLRKALNFSNEGFYNIWRIAVRIVLPLSIVVAIVSFLCQLVG